MQLTTEEQAQVISAGRDLIAADLAGYSYQECTELIEDLASVFESIFRAHNIRFGTGYEWNDEGLVRETYSDGTFGEWE